MTLPGGVTVGTLGSFGLTVAGGMLFGPVGFAAGALLGSFLFGSGSGPDVEGPRLGDLSVSSATYGGVIPVAFGVQKVAGQMIWATDIDEDKNTEKVGGGIFGGGQKIIEYKYFANFAVAFGEGPAGGVLRIWAGEKLIADLRTDSGAKASHKKYKYRIYLGTEDQEPDPFMRQRIEASDDFDGSNAVSAHRGLVYIVFEDMPLDEFGNRIPPITAEISFAGARATVINDTTRIAATSYNTGYMALDPARGVFYYWALGPEGFGRVRIATMTEEIRVDSDDILTDINGPQVVDADGFIYATFGITEQSFRKIDPDSFQVVASASFSSQVQLETLYAYTLAGRITFVAALGFLGCDTRVYFAEDLTTFWTGPSFSSRPRGVVAGLQDFGACEVWFAGAPSIVLGGATATVQILHVRLELPFALNPLTGTAQTVKYTTITLTAADYGAADMTIDNICYDEQNDRIIFFGDLDGVSHLWSYSKDDGVVWRVEAEGELPSQARFKNGLIYAYRVSGGFVDVRSVDDGSLLFSQSGYAAGSSIVRFDPETEALYIPTGSSGVEQWLIGRSSDDTDTLSEVVTALCERVGLEASDLDVTALTDEVLGFGIARQLSVRGALELLAVTYGFDVVESDHTLKFRKRGQSVSRVLSEDDLVPLSEREIYGETRIQEVDLPVRFSTRYQSADRDAEVASQTAKRIKAPDAAMYSDNEATLDLPITLADSTAMGVALRQLFSAWLERVQHEWRTSWENIDLEPGDVIQIALNDGSLFTVRILVAELGANLEIEWKTVVEESSSYTVTAVASGGLNYLPQVDPVSSEARLFPLDIPLIEDRDDVERVSSGLYWAAGAYFDPAWRNAILFSSDDGAAFVVVDETFDAISWGSARNALGDTDLPFQTDTVNELQVHMVSGSLSSVTNLEMLNGANLAALIHANGDVELLQFQDVSLSDGVYTLTTLLRGRRGTEVFTSGHAIGDVFVLLDSESVQRIPIALTRVGDTLYYRVVGRGGDLRDVANKLVVFEGNDLKPYAPAHLTASAAVMAGGDVDFTWVRRTRVGGELIDGYGDVPLAEDTEEYELDLVRDSGEVARTETGLTSEAYTYTAADQTTDHDTLDPVVLVRVYQISAQVGRGFAAELDLENEGTFAVVSGEPDADGACGSSRNFQSASTLAQKYTAGTTGDLVSVYLYFNGTGTPDIRVGIYSDNAGAPDALLAEGTGVAPGAVGWYEVTLTSPLAVTDTDEIWVAAQVSANIDSCSPSTVANTGRQLNAQGHASGLADPFAATSSYTNTRGMRFKIEVTP